MFQMMGVFAEFERAIVKECVRAGAGQERGQAARPSPNPGRARTADPRRACEATASRRRVIAARLGVSVDTVQRISRPFVLGLTGAPAD